MYQSDFKGHAIIKGSSQKRFKQRMETLENEHEGAPRFFDTQNKLDFLNWAGKNYVPSMKPEQRPAVTQAPFCGTTVYKSDFEGRSSGPTPIFIREPAIMKFGCSSSLMKTSYNDDYSHKKTDGPEIDCKPRHVDATLCKLFKGSTEYKRQYIKGRKVHD
jgi:hypothetical protein